jgi:Putative sugar-binding domain
LCSSSSRILPRFSDHRQSEIRIVDRLTAIADVPLDQVIAATSLAVDLRQARPGSCRRLNQVVRSNLTDRAVSITGEQLLRIPEVVAVAGGQSKVKAIRAVLMAGFVTTLVTDADTAHELVESAPDPSTLSRARTAAGRINVE